MKHLSFRTVLCGAVLGAGVLLIPSAHADVPGITMDFEDYELGELLGQDQWGRNTGWLGAFEIIEREGPDGTPTKCIATCPSMSLNWPRAHYTIPAELLTSYGWPTKGTYRLSFDVLFERAVAVTIHCFAQTGQNIRFDKVQAFQASYTDANGTGRFRIVPGNLNLIKNIVQDAENGTAKWHHVDIDVDYSTSTFATFSDGTQIGSDIAFTTPVADMTSFGQIALQIPANGSGSPMDYAGFYLDNLSIVRTDTDPREITLVLFR